MDFYVFLRRLGQRENKRKKARLFVIGKKIRRKMLTSGLREVMTAYYSNDCIDVMDDILRVAKEFGYRKK